MNKVGNSLLGYGFLSLCLIIFFMAFGKHESESLPILAFLYMAAFIAILSFSVSNVSYAIVLGFPFFILSVIFIFTFYSELAPSIFGFNSVDSTYYFGEISLLSGEDIFEKFEALTKTVSLPDRGFLYFLSLITFDINYYPVTLLIANTAAHILTAFILYFTTTELFINEQKKSVLFATLYFLNPASVLYIASGLKEILLTLIITIFAYTSVSYFKSGRLSFLLWMYFVALISGLFRLYYPPLLFSVAIVFTFMRSNRLFRIILVFLTACLFITFYFLFQDEIDRVSSLDLSLVRQERISGDGFFEFTALSFSSLFGPFPNLSFLKNEKSLFFAADFFKVFVSIYAFLGIYRAFREMHIFMVSISIFSLANSAVTVLIALSFDYRFFYPVLPITFILAQFGLGMQATNMRFLALYGLTTTFLILYNYRH